MTREELSSFAARNGLTLISTAQFDALCSSAAADLDRDLTALLGRR